MRKKKAEKPREPQQKKKEGKEAADLQPLFQREQFIYGLPEIGRQTERHFQRRSPSVIS